jgi:RND family efflux transporter MFP subunit
MKRWKIWGTIAVIVALAAAVLLGLRLRSNASKSTSLTQVVAVQRGNLVASLTLTGQVSAEKRAELSFDVSKIPLTELKVTAGQQVKEGDVLARIDPASLQRAVDQAKGDLLSAEDALASAKEPYTALDQQKAELDVAQAEAALEEAKLAGADKELRDAASALQQAKDKLTALQSDVSTKEQIERLQWQYNILEVEHGKLLDGNTSEEAADRRLLAYNRMIDAKDNLETAQAHAALDLLNAQNKVTQAEEALAALQSGSRSGAQAQVRNKVAQAEYNLAKAKDSLSKILAGPEAKTVQLAQSRYDAAKATLAQAEATLAAATMVAPFDGTVISVGAEVGDEVSSGVSVVTLADLSKLEVLATVDESDISQVAVGQEATITFDAFPGKKLSGKVLEVPLEGSLVQSVVSYEVPLSLEGAEGLALKSGMTANVKLQVGSRKNVLLLPVLAVKQGEDGNVVLVQDASAAAVQTRVETGLSDGTYVEVLRGLNEGDQVVVEYATTTQQDNRFGGPGTMILIGEPQGGPPAGERPRQ